MPAAIAQGFAVHAPQQYNPNETKHLPDTQTMGGTHSVATTSVAITIPPPIVPHWHAAIPARIKPTVAPNGGATLVKTLLTNRVLTP